MSGKVDPTQCTRPYCRRMVRHPSGRCHDHRKSRVPGPQPVASPPPPQSDKRSTPEMVSSLISEGRTADSWYLDGELHREDGPAQVVYTADETVESETYFRHGKGHRTDGPAEMNYSAKGHLIREVWLYDGYRHREDGPSMTTCDPNTGTKQSEQWWVHGQLHRVGGPAHIDFETDGTVACEYYFRSSNLHRVDGPVEVDYDEEGRSWGDSYAVDGMPCANPAELAEKISSWSDTRIAAEYRHTPLAPLLDEGIEPRRIVQVVGQGVTSVEGVREVLAGAPAEWVRSYLEGSRQ